MRLLSSGVSDVGAAAGAGAGVGRAKSRSMSRRARFWGGEDGMGRLSPADQRGWG